MPWLIEGPQEVSTSEANSGGSSHIAARTWPGVAYADSHAASTPPEDMPLTMVGRPMT